MDSKLGDKANKTDTYTKTEVDSKLGDKVSKVTSTDNAIARYDGTTGKLQDSNVSISDNGNVGIDVTPSDWYNGVRTIDVGDSSAFYGYKGSSAQGYGISSNVYRGNAGNFIYKNTNKATLMESYNGNTIWFAAPIGVAGTVATLTNIMTLSGEGSLLLKSPTGALGYGAGAGATVTQLTSKSTAVTLNKPSGTIYTHNESLAAGASVSLPFSNNLLDGYISGDTLVVNGAYTQTTVNPEGLYRIEASMVGSGGGRIIITNLTSAARAEVLAINFSIVKGARV